MFFFLEWTGRTRRVLFIAVTRWAAREPGVCGIAMCCSFHWRRTFLSFENPGHRRSGGKGSFCRLRKWTRNANFTTEANGSPLYAVSSTGNWKSFFLNSSILYYSTNVTFFWKIWHSRLKGVKKRTFGPTNPDPQKHIAACFLTGQTLSALFHSTSPGKNLLMLIYLSVF